MRAARILVVVALVSTGACSSSSNPTAVSSAPIGAAPTSSTPGSTTPGSIEPGSISPGSTTPPGTTPRIPGIGWVACTDEKVTDTDLDCATVAVPLDYEHPDGATIDLALVRVPASETHARARSCSIPAGRVVPGSTTWQQVVPPSCVHSASRTSI